jgi:methionine-S-sulfoxide reductase
MLKRLKVVSIGILMTVAMMQNLEAKLKSAYFAGGCFWGVEYYLEQQKGVSSVESGFMGGFKKDPSYEDVVYTKTGHIETVKVIYDSQMVDFKSLTKIFFEIHDFTQVGGQGPDIGERYESYIFYNDASERKVAKELIDILTQKGYKVATKLRASTKFYPASKYHQDYYVKHKKQPYCHIYKKIF